MQDKKHNEFKVTGQVVKGKFIIAKKELTERDHVMISEKEADTNNRQTRFNYLHYELAKAESDLSKMKKDELIAYANEKQIEIDATQNKAQIIETIEVAEAIKNEE